jgi:hypothetical protein
VAHGDAEMMKIILHRHPRLTRSAGDFYAPAHRAVWIQACHTLLTQYQHRAGDKRPHRSHKIITFISEPQKSHLNMKNFRTYKT